MMGSTFNTIQEVLQTGVETQVVRTKATMLLPNLNLSNKNYLSNYIPLAK